MKNQYIAGELPKKGGLGQFADLRGGLEKSGRVKTTMYTMSWRTLLISTMAYRHKISKTSNILKLTQ